VLMVLGRKAPVTQPNEHRGFGRARFGQTHSVNSPHRFRHTGMPIRLDRA
jgi:hypothetical protein